MSGVDAASLSHEAPEKKVPPPDLSDMAVQLSDALFDAVRHRLLSAEAGALLSALKLTEPAHVKEPDRPPKVDAMMRKNQPKSYYRWRVRSTTSCLTVRATTYCLEIFLIPADEVPFLAFAEFETRLKARIELMDTNKYGRIWCIDGRRVKTDEILTILDNCLNLLCKDEDSARGKRAALSDKRQVAERADPDKLMQQMQNLAYRLVSQQEELKKQVSRELHDSIIADLLMLKRYMAGDKPLSTEEIMETIDEIVENVRDICNDYSPRNLQDWGLKVSVEGLLERIEERSGITCNLACAAELPRLPDLVQLHVFRIVQEALNNCEKYSHATNVEVSIEHVPHHRLVVVVKDNGKGFDLSQESERSTESGGMGMRSMTQRAEIIRSLYPTTLEVESTEGAGSEVRLKLTLK